MSKTKALKNFNNLSDANFSVLVNTIKSDLHNNPSFQQMYPTYNELEQAVASFNTAYANSSSRSKESISKKNTQRESLTNLLGRTADSINAIANGDRDMLTTTGFELTSDIPVDKNLGQITGFIINTEGIKGRMVSKCDPVKNVVNYLHQYTQSDNLDNAVWTSVSIRTTKYTFVGLESGINYTFRICAVGNNNDQSISPLASSFVL